MRSALSALLTQTEAAPADAIVPPIRSRPAARLALLEAIADGLSAGAGGSRATIVRLDHLQWADESSIEAVAFLARRLHGRPVLLSLSWRREELPDHAASLVAEARSPTGVSIRLGRLDAPETRALVEAMVQRLDAGVDVPALEGLLPESEGLPLDVVEALAAASVLGRSFDLETVRTSWPWKSSSGVASSGSSTTWCCFR